MKILTLAFVVAGIGVIAALWLMIVEGLVAHVLGRMNLRGIESALMRKG
jgi:hypothetical protein